MNSNYLTIKYIFVYILTCPSACDNNRGYDGCEQCGGRYPSALTPNLNYKTNRLQEISEPAPFKSSFGVFRHMCCVWSGKSVKFVGKCLYEARMVLLLTYYGERVMSLEVTYHCFLTQSKNMGFCVAPSHPVERES